MMTTTTDEKRNQNKFVQLIQYLDERERERERRHTEKRRLTLILTRTHMRLDGRDVEPGTGRPASGLPAQVPVARWDICTEAGYFLGDSLDGTGNPTATRARFGPHNWLAMFSR